MGGLLFHLHDPYRLGRRRRDLPSREPPLAMPIYEKILVTLAILAALLYLGWSVFSQCSRRHRGKNACGGCHCAKNFALKKRG
jgi:hypothetical protein